MLMVLVSELSVWGFRYHDKKSNKFANVSTSKEFAYHVYMMKLYTEILKKTLESDKLRTRYLK